MIDDCTKRIAAIEQKTETIKAQNKQLRDELDNLQKQQAQRIASIKPQQITLTEREQAQLKEALASANHDAAAITVLEIQQLLDAINFKISSLESDLRNATLAAGQSQLAKEQVQHIQKQLSYQRDLLDAERQYLEEAKRAFDLSKLQLNFAKQWREELEVQYKIKQRMLRQQQLFSKESELEQQQQQWAEKLAVLKSQLSDSESNEAYRTEQKREKIELEILEAREHSNLLHIRIVLARLTSQLISLDENIHDNMSLNELNNTLQESTLIYNEIKNLQKNINSKLDIIKRRVDLQLQDFESAQTSPYYLKKINRSVENLVKQYEVEYRQTEAILTKIVAIQEHLQQGLSRILSRRQGLPGFNLAAWESFALSLVQLPSMASQAIEAMAIQIKNHFLKLGTSQWLMLIIIELAWLWACFMTRRLLLRLIISIQDKRQTVANNMLFVMLQLVFRNLIIIFLLMTFLIFIWLSNTPIVTMLPIIYLVLVWLTFRIAIQIARLTLLESIGSVSGNDVKLYRQLRVALYSGEALTMLTVLAHLLPVSLEVSEFFNRLFMLFLAITGALLLRNWQVVPEIVEAFLSRRRLYLMRIVRLLSVLIPLTLLSTGIIGIVGYVDLAWTISIYEGIFLLVMSGYIFARGILNDLMDQLSTLAIRYMSSGWLWTQAILRPLDKIFHILLFFAAIYHLFYFYGWDKESYPVQKIKWLLNFPLIHFEPTVISLWSLIEMIMTVAILIWVARWTREFAFRLIFARTRDLSLRNSLAVLTQYSVVLIILIISLRLIGVDTTGLNYILTALAFGVGFGIRDLARNYVCGFILLIERPVRTGDLITVGEYEGEITHIGMRAVTLNTWDHMDVLVPNSAIFESTFTNWTRNDSIVRSVVLIKINRQDDPEFIREIIENVLKQSDNVVSDPCPQVFMKELQDPLLEFELRYFIDLNHGKARPEVRSQVLFEIWQAFKKHDIKAPYPQQDIHIRTIEQPKQLQEVIIDAKGN